MSTHQTRIEQKQPIAVRESPLVTRLKDLAQIKPVLYGTGQVIMRDKIIDEIYSIKGNFQPFSVISFKTTHCIVMKLNVF